MDILNKIKALFLDIDGTITNEAHDLDPRISLGLEALYKEGWQIVFVTGRSYLWSRTVLSGLKIPYYLAIENGSLILEMPHKKVISKNYIKKEILAAIKRKSPEIFSRTAIYSGFINQDLCYFAPLEIDKKLLNYMTERASQIGETLVPLVDITNPPLEEFAALKVFGQKKDLLPFKDLLPAFNLKAPILRDPLRQDFSLILCTSGDKGSVVDFFRAYFDLEFSISAGDDHNDIPMMQKTDISIAMPHASDEVLEKANIISEPVEKQGVLKALRLAINYLQGSYE